MGNRCFVPLEGGEIEIIHVPTPGGGGVEWRYTVPANYEITLLSLRFELLTGAVPGVRKPGIVFENAFDPVLEQVWIPTSLSVPEGETYTLNFWLGSQRQVGVALTNSWFDALPLIRWPAGTSWGSKTYNLKPGDLYPDIWQVVAKWRV